MPDNKSYNYLALRGAGVDDMEFVEQYGLNPDVAYTPKINDVMLEVVYQQNIEAGIDEATAMKNKADASRNIKELLAKNGMLK